MDQPYSAWADWLSKFHTWPELIQVLWLVSVPLTLLGVTWLVMRNVRDLIPLLFRRRERGYLIYGVYQDPRGRWMVYQHGSQPQVIDWTDSPPELIRRGTMVERMFRWPE